MTDPTPAREPVTLDEQIAAIATELQYAMEDGANAIDIVVMCMGRPRSLRFRLTQVKRETEKNGD